MWMWRGHFVLSPSALRSCLTSFCRHAWEGRGDLLCVAPPPPAPSSQDVCAGLLASLPALLPAGLLEGEEPDMAGRDWQRAGKRESISECGEKQGRPQATSFTCCLCVLLKTASAEAGSSPECGLCQGSRGFWKHF